MTTPNDDPDLTTLMAHTTAWAVINHVESIISAYLDGDRSERRIQHARELALEDLTSQFRIVFEDLEYTHEHSSKETNA